MDHINKVKAFTDQLACLMVPLKDEDIVMSCSRACPPPTSTWLRHWRRQAYNGVHDDTIDAWGIEVEGKKCKGDDATMVLRQGKAYNSFSHQYAKMCFYCGKPNDVAHFCFKAKNKERKNANNENGDDDYAFATWYEAHSENAYKWILDLGTTKYMISYSAVSNTYQIIAPHNVHLDGDRAMVAINMSSIAVEMVTKGTIKFILSMPSIYPNCMQTYSRWANLCRMGWRYNSTWINALLRHLTAKPLPSCNTRAIYNKCVSWRCMEPMQLIIFLKLFMPTYHNLLAS